MASIVDIVLRVKKEGEGVKDTEDSLLKLGKTLAVAAAAVTAFGVVAKKAFDLAQEGAAISQTAESFDLLIEKVGAAPNLLEQLNDAAGGTISQMGLMTSTATLLAGASGDLATQLADSTPRLLEIARAANKLNPSLGDTTFLYQSIATGIKRASPLILDNLGLTIKVGEANERYAEALGKSVEELTAEEQKQALLNETLRAGDVLIDQVGGSLDSATDSYTRFGAEATNATDRMKEQLHFALEPLVGALADGIAFSNQLAESERLLGGTIDIATGSVRLASGELISYAEANERAAEIADVLSHTWNTDYVNAAREAAEETDGLTTSHDNLSLSMDSIQKAIAGKLGDAWEEYESVVRETNEPLSEFIARQQDAEEAIADTTRELIFQTASAGLNEEATLALARSMGFLSEEDYAVIEATRLLREQYDLADGALDGVIANTEGYTGAIDTLTARLDPAIVGLDEAARLLKLLEDTDNISVTVDLITRGFSTGYLENIQSAGGYYDPRLGTYVPRKAHGGPVSGGSPYMVGEHGPEMFVPNSGGSVVSNTNVRINEDALRSEIKGLRSDLARYQETMPLMINAATEKALR